MLDTTKATSERNRIEQAIASARTAVNAVDDTATEAEVQAAENAITAIGTAITNADNVPANEKSGFVGQHEFLQETLNLSKRSRDMAMEAVQRQAIEDAIDEAQGLVAELNDGATEAEVQAARDAVTAIGTAIMNASNVPQDEILVFTGEQEALQGQLDRSIGSRDMAMGAMEEAQRKAINDAITEARTAVSAVNNGATDDEVQDAETAIAAIETAIMNAENIPENEKSGFNQTKTSLMSELDMAKSSRNTAIGIQTEAKKLYDGIRNTGGDTGNAPGNGLPVTDGYVNAAYNDDGVPQGTDGDTLIMVGIETEVPVALMEDEDEMVGDNHGWEGKRYMTSVSFDDNNDQDNNPGPNGMYEAMVYSKVYEDEPPGEGEIFSARYTLDDGSIAVSDDVSGIVKSEHFTYTSGAQTFDEYKISGTYDGAPGTYTCNSDDPLVKLCAVQVDPDGYQLGLVDTDDNNNFEESTTSTATWYFTPDDPSYQFPGKPGTYNYISYGWWMYTSEDESEYTASAFFDEAGNAVTPTVGDLDDDTSGTAKYVGGAAGKYALHNESAAGRNDSGHFTAKVTLEADFNDLSITGTIDEFMGADGMKPWSVELKEAVISPEGVITSPLQDDVGTEDVDESATTVWMIDEMAADPSGTWSGQFHDNSADKGDSVPKVATGMFFSEYGDEGKMVGAFGVDVTELNGVDIED